MYSNQVLELVEALKGIKPIEVRVMYGPQWKKLDTLIESSESEQVSQVSGQLVDG